jgi:outer membrane biogenesis lipoprotein LolB
MIKVTGVAQQVDQVVVTFDYDYQGSNYSDSAQVTLTQFLGSTDSQRKAFLKNKVAALRQAMASEAVQTIIKALVGVDLESP